MKPTFHVSTKAYSLPGADASVRSVTGVTLTLAIKFDRVIETPTATATTEADAIFSQTLGETLADDSMPAATEPEHKTRRTRFGPEHAAGRPGGAAAGLLGGSMAV